MVQQEAADHKAHHGRQRAHRAQRPLVHDEVLPPTHHTDGRQAGRQVAGDRQVKPQASVEPCHDTIQAPLVMLPATAAMAWRWSS